MKGVLLDEEHGQALARVEVGDDLEDLLDDERGEPERRLVEQQQFWPAHQRARDGEHLLLAARQRAAALVRGALLGAGRSRRHARARRRSRHARRTRAPSRRFSATVMREKMRRPSGDCAMPSRAIWCVGSSVMSCPSNRMRPWRARGLPKIVIISVDLPAPLAPMSVTISPFGTAMIDVVQRVDVAVAGGDALECEQRLGHGAVIARPPLPRCATSSSSTPR